MDCISAMTSAIVAGLVAAMSPLPGGPEGDDDGGLMNCLPGIARSIPDKIEHPRIPALCSLCGIELVEGSR
jgi:hypothetical protein